MSKFIFYYKQYCLVNYLLLYLCRIFPTLLGTRKLSSKVFATISSSWAMDECSHCLTLLPSPVRCCVIETSTCTSRVANELEYLSVYSKVIHLPFLWNVCLSFLFNFNWLFLFFLLIDWLDNSPLLVINVVRIFSVLSLYFVVFMVFVIISCLI